MNKSLLGGFALAVSCFVIGCGKQETPVADPAATPQEAAVAVAEEAAEDVTEVATPPLPPAPPTSGPSPFIARPDVNLYQLDLDSVQKQLIQLNAGYNGSGQIIQQGPGVLVSLSQMPISNITPLKSLPILGMEAAQTDIEDLTPLRNMPMDQLYLEETKVWNLEPLRGMSLTRLYLSNTFVKDIGPLKGMPIEELNLVGTPLGDISALEGMPLKTLWLTGTRVSDVSPLLKSPLVSLTLHKTRVSDISPLANIKTLERLHIGETGVTDLSAIAGMNLSRLVFTPSKITKGLDAVRNSTSIRELGLQFEQQGDVMPPGIFWQRHDAGEFKAAE
jgi:Leucine-rich repeat (LRR) protein